MTNPLDIAEHYLRAGMPDKALAARGTAIPKTRTTLATEFAEANRMFDAAVSLDPRVVDSMRESFV